MQKSMSEYDDLVEASAVLAAMGDPRMVRLSERLAARARRIAPRAPMMLARHGSYLYLGPPDKPLVVPHPEHLGLDYFEQIVILGQLAPASLDAARMIGNWSHAKPGKVVRECIVKASEWIEAVTAREAKGWGADLARELRHPLLRIPDNGLGIERVSTRPIVTVVS
jgi:hypothetical protein